MKPLRPIDTLSRRGSRRTPSRGARRGIMAQLAVWRARRSMRRMRYRLDGRPYRGVFGPGFFALIRGARFWGTGGGAKGGSALYKAIGSALAIAAAGLALWAMVASIRAIGIFYEG